ncbi:MAG TPA: hypothetical protein VGG68_00830 [Caulobacteraceae bacterium]|jgi:hypothetical protein
MATRYFQVVDVDRQRLIAVDEDPIGATRTAREWIIQHRCNVTIYEVETNCVDIWDFAAESLREYPATLRGVPFRAYETVISQMAGMAPPSETIH